MLTTSEETALKRLDMAHVIDLMDQPGWRVLVGLMDVKEAVLLSRLTNEIKRGKVPEISDVVAYQQHAKAFAWVKDSPRRAQVAYSKLRKDDV